MTVVASPVGPEISLGLVYGGFSQGEAAGRLDLAGNSSRFRWSCPTGPNMVVQDWVIKDAPVPPRLMQTMRELFADLNLRQRQKSDKPTAEAHEPLVSRQPWRADKINPGYLHEMQAVINRRVIGQRIMDVTVVAEGRVQREISLTNTIYDGIRSSAQLAGGNGIDSEARQVLRRLDARSNFSRSRFQGFSTVGVVNIGKVMLGGGIPFSIGDLALQTSELTAGQTEITNEAVRAQFVQALGLDYFRQRLQLSKGPGEGLGQVQIRAIPHY